MDIQKLTKSELTTIAMENARALGPVANSVYEDLGYAPFDALPEVVESAEAAQAQRLLEAEKQARKLELSQAAAEFICGDCLHVVPCEHVAVDARGNRKILG